ncbi:hypothetical protein HDU87_005233 [Geranomyces variabilis]|uniref:Uncharacterized protein n=1 Tax=Geranomyces variabilis TaxID=109894 RepID=A0AAD5TJQ6_9FUNG|nr:hypothetical protein HDU87_005233 [Geranomyces variabilis]
MDLCCDAAYFNYAPTSVRLSLALAPYYPAATTATSRRTATPRSITRLSLSLSRSRSRSRSSSSSSAPVAAPQSPSSLSTATLPPYAEVYDEPELLPPPAYAVACGRRTWYRKTLERTQSTLSQLRGALSDQYWTGGQQHHHHPGAVLVSLCEFTSGPASNAHVMALLDSTPSDATQSRLSAWLATIGRRLWERFASTDKSQQKEEGSQQQQSSPAVSATAGAISLPARSRLAPERSRDLAATRTQTLAKMSPSSNSGATTRGATTGENTCHATHAAGSKVDGGGILPRAVDDGSYLDELFDLCETRSSNDGDSERE